MLTAFIEIWVARLRALVAKRTEVDRARVVEEGKDIADTLLTSASGRSTTRRRSTSSSATTSARSSPPTGRSGRDDKRFGIRERVRRAFAAYGIRPASGGAEGGYWKAPEVELDYSRTHFEPMQRDADEVFHFLVGEPRPAAPRPRGRSRA